MGARLVVVVATARAGPGSALHRRRVCNWGREWIMATPVGPVDRDPNDPDLWDEWNEDDDDLVVAGRPATRLRLIAVVVLVAMAVLAVLAR